MSVNTEELMKYAKDVREKDDYLFLPELLEDSAREISACRLRIRELEQQLMTEAEKRAAFEKDCG